MHERAEALLTAEEIAPLVGKQPRTIYDWWDTEKLRFVRVGKRGKRSTMAMVEARQRELLRPAPAAPGAATGSAAHAAQAIPPLPTEYAGARMYLGPDASPEAIAGLAAEIREHRELMLRLEVQARLFFLQDFFRRVRKSVSQLEHVAPGVVAAALTMVVSLGALAG